MKTNIKLAIVITDINIAGAQKMVVDMLPIIAATFPSTELIVLNPRVENYLAREIDGNRVNTHFLNNKSSNPIVRKIQTWTFLKRKLNEYEPDLIFVNLDYVYSWYYAFLRKQRIIETFHTQPYRIATKKNKLCVHYLYKRKILKPVLLTKSGAKEFESIFRIDSKDIEIIPNPVDIRKFSVDHTDSDVIRICNIGRFHEIKNQKFLIFAFADALMKYDNMQLSFAGEGENLDECRKYVEELGLTSKVFFLGEIEDVPKLLSNTDIYVVCSNSESFSLSMVEAMAAGLPVVATRVGGIIDIVDGNGFLVSPDDCREMSERLVELAENKELREKLGRKSVEIAKEYSLEKVVNMYLKLFEREYTK